MTVDPRWKSVHSLGQTLFLFVMLTLPGPLFAADSVAVENAKTGTGDWRIGTGTGYDFPAANDAAQPSTPVDCKTTTCFSQGAIEGYASATSVAQGQTINLYVKTAEQYSMRIFRMGWYGGAGGREVTPVDLQAPRSPLPQTSDRYCTSSAGYATYGLIECNWSSPYELTVPTDWVSGVYLVKLTTVTNLNKYILFVVRDDTRPSPYLFQLPVTTYQAYNVWGGTSLYVNKSTTAYAASTDCDSPCSGGGVKASFLRPYQGDYGAGQFFTFDFSTLRFLESEGYDITYATDIDTHANPLLLNGHKAFLSVGHDEYWSWEMRSNVERARERGISLAFLGANSIYWRIRLEPSTLGVPQPNQTVVTFRGTTTARLNHWGDPESNDPLGHDVTTLWRQKPEPRPEQALMGVQFMPYGIRPGVHICQSGDMTIANTTSWPSWLIAGTNLHDGSTLPGLLGHETDVVDSGTGTDGTQYAPFIQPGTIKLAESLFPSPANVNAFTYDGPPPTPTPETPIPANMSYYQAASGAHVFSVGTLFWSWGLDTFHLIQGVAPGCSPASWQFPAVSEPARQIMRNYLNRVGQASPSSSDTAPVQWSEPTLAGVSVNTAGNILTKSSTAYAWDSGAVSTQQLESGDGYVEVTASETTLARAFGLTHTHSQNTVGDIQFGLQLGASGVLYLVESGQYGPTSTYVTGDKLRVAVVGGTIQYTKNGSVVWSSTPALTYPLMVDAQFFSPQATLQDAVVSEGFSTLVQWTAQSLSGVEIVNTAGNNVRKSAASYAWDSGAVSAQQLDSGNGYVEVTASETTLARAFGLTHVHSQNTIGDIQFGLQLGAGGVLYLVESGQYGPTSTYVTGDKLRVAVVGGAIQYTKNGSVVWSSTPTLTYPLMVDAQFFSPQSTLKSVVVSPGFSRVVRWMSSSFAGVATTNSAGNNLVKSATTYAWDAGAVSTQQFYSGNGYAEVTASETNLARAFGLSHLHGQNTVTDIEFGLQLGAGGVLYRVESGQYGATDTYVTGDKLRVAVVGGAIQYTKNGSVLWSSTPALMYPLMVDAQFFSPQATLEHVVMSPP
jgi:uncharacterized protein YaiE (UPF0345 family)